MNKPRLAILFWFYSEPEVCEERIGLLRGLNPGLPIYGLYGGPAEAAPAVRARLGPLLDDLHVYAGSAAPEWKWRHGDRLIADWHVQRGGALAWDTLVVVQWDLLLTAPVDGLFGALAEGEALFSGARPMAEVAGWWGWAKGDDPDKRAELAAFEVALRGALGYVGPLWCCLFIVIVLPRAFLDCYAAEAPEAGFLEYKAPTLARAFGTPIRLDPTFDPWWAADPATRDAPARDRALNAMSDPVSPGLVAAELARPDGRRAFHPVRGLLPPALLRAIAGG